jgi:hypothetical protein
MSSSLTANVISLQPSCASIWQRLHPSTFGAAICTPRCDLHDPAAICVTQLSSARVPLKLTRAPPPLRVRVAATSPCSLSSHVALQEVHCHIYSSDRGMDNPAMARTYHHFATHSYENDLWT